MKLKNIVRALYAFAAAALFFAGCSNYADNYSGEKGRLSFAAEASSRAVNTVEPKSGFDFATATDLTFSLAGKKSGGTEEEIKNWNSYSEMKSDTSVLVDTGKWNFRLSVTKGGKEVLFGTLEKTIVAGPNTLDFGTLKEPTASDGKNVANGSVRVTLKFPSDGKVLAADAVLSLLDSESSENAESLSVSAGTEAGSVSSSVVYSKEDVAPGIYILKISLYSSLEKTDGSYLNSYTALVNVVPGLSSTGEGELTDINTLYTIKYELEGGSFADGTALSTTYNKHAKIILPTPAKQGYTFKGWAETQSSTEVKHQGNATIQISKDTSLFAVWEAKTVTVTFNANGGSFGSGTPGSSVDAKTGKYGASLVKPEDPKKGIADFMGWSETQSGSATVTFPSTFPAENTTYYAVWNEYTAKELKITLTKQGSSSESESVTELQTGEKANVKVACVYESGGIEKKTKEIWLTGTDATVTSQNQDILKIEGSSNVYTAEALKAGTATISAEYTPKEGTEAGQKLTGTLSVTVNAAQKKDLNLQFTDNKNWGTVFAYFFTSSGTSGQSDNGESSDTSVGAKWPGIQLISASASNEGTKKYTVTVPEGATHVIFNSGNNGNQTVDIALPASDTGYEISDEQEASKYKVTSNTVSGLANTVSLKFTNNKNWGSVYAYFYDSTKTDSENSYVGLAWPGTQLQYSVNNAQSQPQYTLSVPEGATHVIFNSGSNGEQTVDIALPTENKGYYLSDSGTKVEFKNDKNWNPVYAYFFTGSSPVGDAWPGKQLSDTDKNSSGNYTVAVPSGATKVIFNNGNGEQTVDIELSQGYEVVYSITDNSENKWNVNKKILVSEFGFND